MTPFLDTILTYLFLVKLLCLRIVNVVHYFPDISCQQIYAKDAFKQIPVSALWHM